MQYLDLIYPTVLSLLIYLYSPQGQKTAKQVRYDTIQSLHSKLICQFNHSAYELKVYEKRKTEAKQEADDTYNRNMQKQ